MPSFRGSFDSAAPRITDYAGWQAGDTYTQNVGDQTLTYTYSGDPTNPFPTQPTVAARAQTASQAASAKKNNTQATKDNIVTLAGGIKMMIATDDDGNPITDPDNPGVPLMVPLQSGDAAKAYLDGLVQKNALTKAQADQINSKVSSEIANTQAQTGSLQANTQQTIEQIKQLKQGQLGTFITQISALPGMSTDQKMQLIDEAVGKAINDYSDAAAKATAVSSFNQTKAQQATQMANIATGFLNNAISSSNQLAAAGGGATGVGGLISNMQGLLQMMGGAPAQLQNPLDQWKPAPKLDSSLISALQNATADTGGSGSQSAAGQAPTPKPTSTVPNLTDSIVHGLLGDSSPVAITGQAPDVESAASPQTQATPPGNNDIASSLLSTTSDNPTGVNSRYTQAGQTLFSPVSGMPDTHPGQVTPTDLANIARYQQAGYSYADAVNMAHGDALQRDFGSGQSMLPASYGQPVQQFGNSFLGTLGSTLGQGFSNLGSFLNNVNNVNNAAVNTIGAGVASNVIARDS